MRLRILCLAALAAIAFPACGGSSPGAVEPVAQPALLTREALADRGREIQARIASGALRPSEEARLDGDLPRAERLFAEAFPEDDAATRFYTGNLLFRLDPERSFRDHEAAATQGPDVPEVALEWAMQLHRAGRCGEAISFYRTALGAMNMKAPYALLAHCLLVEGRLDDAIAAFRQADHGHHHTAIEQLFFDISTTPEPWRRRAELIAAAERDPSRWSDVIVFDIEFPTDWWNSGVNAGALGRDLVRMRVALSGDPELRDDLDAIARWRTGEWSDAQMAEHASRRVDLVGELAVAPFLIEALLATGATTPSRALTDLGPALDRAMRAGDARALRIMAALTSADASPDRAARLAEIDASAAPSASRCTARRGLGERRRARAAGHEPRGREQGGLDLRGGRGSPRR